IAPIYNDLSKLHGDEKYADVTVTCGEHTLRLHRAIICSQSPFFETACSGGFKESTTGHISIEEVDPDIFAKSVKFIYTGNYPDEDHLNPQSCDEAILEHIEHLIASFRQGTNIPGLDWYDMKLWEDAVPKYSDHSMLLCRCGTAYVRPCVTQMGRRSANIQASRGGTGAWTEIPVPNWSTATSRNGIPKMMTTTGHSRISASASSAQGALARSGMNGYLTRCNPCFASTRVSSKRSNGFLS
ncbi:BTB/POZ protein, partial [Corynascus novoguineensis]